MCFICFILKILFFFWNGFIFHFGTKQCYADSVFLFSFQADSLEEAISFVNENKYFVSNYFVSFAFVKLPFISYSDFSNRYGNGATIFTRSGVAARKFQTEIEAGQVWCFAFALGNTLTDNSSYGFESVYALCLLFVNQTKCCMFPLAIFSLPQNNRVKFFFYPYITLKQC